MPNHLARGLLACALLASSALALPLAPAQATDPGADPAVTGPAARGGGVAPGLQRADDLPAFAPGEVMVRFAPKASAASKAAARGRVGGNLARKLPVRGLELLKVKGGVKAAVVALEKRPDVLYAEPNYLYRTTGTVLPDDPYLPYQWALHNIGQSIFGAPGTADADIDAPEAWATATGDESVTVAVVDSGVAVDHPDLEGNIWKKPGETLNGLDDDGNGLVDDVHGWDYVDFDNETEDLDGHGTHVAGIIGATGDDGIGVAGVAWDVSIMPLRAFGPQGGYNSDIVSAFKYAVANGADVVNASFGGKDGSYSIEAVIKEAPETLFVAAAGNNGTNNEQSGTPIYPCNFKADNVICVGASDDNDQLAPFSNYGTTSVDLAAPGVGILSTVPAQDTYFAEDFDTGLGDGWATGGTSTWGTEPTDFGPALSDSPGTTYAADANTWVQTTSPIDLSGQRGCKLGYWLDLDTQTNYDYLHVEASTNGGDTWSRVALWSGSTEGEWFPMVESLERWQWSAKVHIRFRLTSNATVQRDGARIDDVAVYCTGEEYDGDEYDVNYGTSMATPHVSGTAALLLAAAPGSGVATVRRALLDGVDVKPGLSNLLTGGRLNAARSLELMKPLVEFGRATTLVQENVKTAYLPVVRTRNLDVPATVAYARTGGNATPGSDFEVAPGTLHFAAGETRKTIPVTITNDAAREAAETVVLTLAPKGPGTAVGARSATSLTIRPSDQRPDLWISRKRGVEYVGDNVYNTTGRKQTKTHPTYRGQRSLFFIRVQNDGNVTNSIKLRANPAVQGSRVTYFKAGVDVSSRILSADGLNVRLAPGEQQLLSASVHVLKHAEVGSIKTAVVKATWTGDGTRTDVTKARAKVIR
jgi:subtilisin family serine protease